MTPTIKKVLQAVFWFVVGHLSPLNIPEAHAKFATDEQCLQYIEKMRWRRRVPSPSMRRPVHVKTHFTFFFP
jgi:hypothetical protein